MSLTIASSDKLYAALFNSKITAGKGATAVGTGKQGGSKTAGKIFWIRWGKNRRPICSIDTQVQPRALLIHKS